MQVRSAVLSGPGPRTGAVRCAELTGPVGNYKLCDSQVPNQVPIGEVSWERVHTAAWVKQAWAKKFPVHPGAPSNHCWHTLVACLLSTAEAITATIRYTAVQHAQHRRSHYVTTKQYNIHS